MLEIKIEVDNDLITVISEDCPIGNKTTECPDCDHGVSFVKDGYSGRFGPMIFKCFFGVVV